MKQTVRAFAIGLLTAGAIIAGIYYISEDGSANKKAMTRDEMADELKEQGYRIITEEEYISFKVQKDKQQAELNKKQQSTAKSPSKTQSEKNSTEDDKEDSSEKAFTLQIASGMKTAEISEMLADNGIIEDARKFDDYLEKNDYANKIQVGKHTLSNRMSEKEIAETLTK
ncbi:hypothetical protein QR721_07830 [Aciduricibacillus chroicocephali]|uniref:Endolytic transglycosylase MltG n=1 Tax=Aciduricibacillus chroicocephali TaxID=3054939 RepID=A0ABY9KS00_9BACI|nr:hypothetical protein QR721_07830 [Bacillaceae bacterium 44XB]